MNNATNIKKMLSVVIFITIAAIVVVYFRLYDLSNVRSIVASTGKWSPIVFILFCVIRPIVILPIGLFSVLGGLMFGPIRGTIYTILGSTIGSVIAYYMAKYWGRDWIENIFGNKMNKLDDKCRTKGFTVTFLMRVVPILPCDVVSYVCGLSEIKLSDFILGTFIGIIPGTFVYSYFGNSLNNIYSKQFIISIIVLLLLSAFPLILKKFSKKDLAHEMGIDFNKESND